MFVLTLERAWHWAPGTERVPSFQGFQWTPCSHQRGKLVSGYCCHFGLPPAPWLSLPWCQKGASANRSSDLFRSSEPGSALLSKNPILWYIAEKFRCCQWGWDCCRPGMGRWFDFSLALFVVLLEHGCCGSAQRAPLTPPPPRLRAAEGQGRRPGQDRVWKDG